MKPSVFMDTSPDYLQFASQNPDFAVGFDGRIYILAMTPTLIFIGMVAYPGITSVYS
jgi:hypothetical protein